ncbi:MAG TPA: acyl-CoA dehydrogenase [Spirochaetota bacterium]|nr:acyl-CoA dehydrogenase [Spirochaetota bacterium]
MGTKFYSEENLKFLLQEVHDIDEIFSCDTFSDYNVESMNIILDTAKNIASGMMYPYFSEMDKNPPEYTGSTIKVHPSVKPFLEKFAEGGWINASFPSDIGGQQMPFILFNACMFIFASANYSMSVYPGLTSGALALIYQFATKELYQIFAPPMIAGKWQGTMALTEPEAGSSLSDVKTMAIPTDKGYYLIKGQKTFISAGDHDAVENIVHLMLARIKDAPQGVKGLSLFIVPKYRPDENGKLIFNDVNCAGCYHKMGYKGAPIAQLSMGEADDCRGYLVGEPNKGLSYMFHMMNEARINVGLGAAAIAGAAYQTSLEYAKERRQGRKITEKNPSVPQIPIIHHADVKRMLLKQKAIVEGSLSLIIQTGKLVDLINTSAGEEKEKYELFLDMLTPIVKTYPAEMGVVSTSLAIQCMGGYGYSSEFPVEQYMRDSRIHPIHEGTTGIQGMDLLGRKVTMKNGATAKVYMTEIYKTIASAKQYPSLISYAEDLDKAAALWQEVTGFLIQFAVKGDIERFLADATLFLEFSGLICIAWQWLLQGIAVQNSINNSSGSYSKDFLEGKMQTLAYFFRYELTGIYALEKIIRGSDGLTVSMQENYFED